eukprot:scaffold1498_cov314-Prasinococcus_capsulatus_cf.AAC.2
MPRQLCLSSPDPGAVFFTAGVAILFRGNGEGALLASWCRQTQPDDVFLLEARRKRGEAGRLAATAFPKETCA